MQAGSARFGTIKAQTLSNQVELVLVFIIIRWSRFFMKIKDYRRVTMRFEKLAGRFLAMVRLVSCLVWLA